MRIMLLAFLLCIFLAGCIDITINHEIKANGDSSIVFTYDFGAMQGQMAAMNEDLNNTGDSNEEFMGGIEETCANITNPGWDDFQCYAEGNKLIISGGVSLTEDQFVVEKSLFGATYTYDAETVKELFPEDEGESEIDFDNMAMMKSMGFDFTYIITMPAPIKSFDKGNLKSDGKTIEIDFFDIDGPTLIVAEKKSVLLLILGSILGIIIIGGLLFFFLSTIRKNNLKKNGNSPIPPPEQNETPQALVQAAEQALARGDKEAANRAYTELRLLYDSLSTEQKQNVYQALVSIYEKLN